MIKNFLIINCIGKDDKLGLRINKDFFVHDIRKKNNYNQILVSEIMNILNILNIEVIFIVSFTKVNLYFI